MYMKLINVFVDIIIIIKVVFLGIILSIKYNETKKHVNKNKIQTLERRREIFHESFFFLMYILLIVLFNPFTKESIVDVRNEHHIKLLLFTLGILGLINIDYTKTFHIIDALKGTM